MSLWRYFIAVVSGVSLVRRCVMRSMRQRHGMSTWRDQSQTTYQGLRASTTEPWDSIERIE